MLLDNYGTIIKHNIGSGFLNIKQAFGLDKICLEFGKYDSPATKKLKETINCYISMEELPYIAHIFKTGQIVKLCENAKRDNPYAAGYEALSGTTTSKQLKIQSNEGKIYIKALEGPGKKADNGLTIPQYTEKTADKKIVITVTLKEIMVIGFALERAIFYYDTWMANGTLEENLTKMRYQKESGNTYSKPTNQGTPYYGNQLPYSDPLQSVESMF